AGDGASQCALLYTSGTTGQPKGCVLTNTYFLYSGDWYRDVGGLIDLGRDGERMITPLPLFHMNAMAVSVMAMLSVGGSLTMLD
ncbi:AMP-binding protein, partial [Bacillus siamensis]|nr:AMP-binding protein [Bacillus siamensis]